MHRIHSTARSAIRVAVLAMGVLAASASMAGRPANVGSSSGSGSGSSSIDPNVAVPQKATDDHLPEYSELVFEDNFDGTTLDRSKWCTRYIYSGGPAPQVPDLDCQRFNGGTLDYLNDEQQRYVDVNSKGESMHVFGGGALTLRATKTRRGKAAYESAMLRSKALFRPSAHAHYYVTARMYLPNVRGTWPAFWLNSDFAADGTTNWPPEIDIMEGALNDNWDTHNMLSMHAQPQNWGGTGVGKTPTYTYVSPEFDPARATFVAKRTLREVWVEVGVEWTASEMCFFVDAYKVACQAYEWRYNSGVDAPAAHLLLNLAIGGSWAGAFGIDDTRMPTGMRIDYVRVYKRAL